VRIAHVVLISSVCVTGCAEVPQKANQLTKTMPSGTITYEKRIFSVQSVIFNNTKVATWQVETDSVGFYAMNYSPDGDMPAALKHGVYSCDHGKISQTFDPQRPFQGYLNGCPEGDKITLTITR
jgi:hypothetical protein